MPDNTSENLIRLFGMTGHMLTEELARIEADFDVELGHAPPHESHESDSYYQQFSLAVRYEARMMASHYEVFYCLEKDTRSRVAQAMEDQLGAGWWKSGKVPSQIVSEVQKRIQREADAGVTRRSADPLDYTTFGELSGIITANWDIFGAIFSSQKAVEKVMSSLNSLRGSIAHCSPLAPDEVLRLRLTLRDWFRLME